MEYLIILGGIILAILAIIVLGAAIGFAIGLGHKIYEWLE